MCGLRGQRRPVQTATVCNLKRCHASDVKTLAVTFCLS